MELPSWADYSFQHNNLSFWLLTEHPHDPIFPETGVHLGILPKGQSTPISFQNNKKVAAPGGAILSHSVDVIREPSCYLLPLREDTFPALHWGDTIRIASVSQTSRCFQYVETPSMTGLVVSTDDMRSTQFRLLPVDTSLSGVVSVDPHIVELKVIDTERYVTLGKSNQFRIRPTGGRYGHGLPFFLDTVLMDFPEGADELAVTGYKEIGTFSISIPNTTFPSVPQKSSLNVNEPFRIANGYGNVSISVFWLSNHGDGPSNQQSHPLAPWTTGFTEMWSWNPSDGPIRWVGAGRPIGACRAYGPAMGPSFPFQLRTPLGMYLGVDDSGAFFESSDPADLHATRDERVDGERMRSGEALQIWHGTRALGGPVMFDAPILLHGSTVNLRWASDDTLIAPGRDPEVFSVRAETDLDVPAAKQVAAKLGGTIATLGQLKEAQVNDARFEYAGWTQVSPGTYGLWHPHPANGLLEKTGTTQHVNVFGVKPHPSLLPTLHIWGWDSDRYWGVPSSRRPPEVYCLSKTPQLGYDFTLQEAIEGVRLLGGTIATLEQLVEAHKNGAEWCSAAWVQVAEEKYEAYYPMQTAKPGCGNAEVNQFLHLSRANVTVFGFKPSPDSSIAKRVFRWSPDAYFRPFSVSTIPRSPKLTILAPRAYIPFDGRAQMVQEQTRRDAESWKTFLSSAPFDPDVLDLWPVSTVRQDPDDFTLYNNSPTLVAYRDYTVDPACLHDSVHLAVDTETGMLTSYGLAESAANRFFPMTNPPAGTGPPAVLADALGVPECVLTFCRESELAPIMYGEIFVLTHTQSRNVRLAWTPATKMAWDSTRTRVGGCWQVYPVDDSQPWGDAIPSPCVCRLRVYNGPYDVYRDELRPFASTEFGSTFTIVASGSKAAYETPISIQQNGVELFAAIPRVFSAYKSPPTPTQTPIAPGDILRVRNARGRVYAGTVSFSGSTSTVCPWSAVFSTLDTPTGVLYVYPRPILAGRIPRPLMGPQCPVAIIENLTGQYLSVDSNGYTLLTPHRLLTYARSPSVRDNGPWADGTTIFLHHPSGTRSKWEDVMRLPNGASRSSQMWTDGNGPSRRWTVNIHMNSTQLHGMLVDSRALQSVLPLVREAPFNPPVVEIWGSAPMRKLQGLRDTSIVDGDVILWLYYDLGGFDTSYWQTGVHLAVGDPPPTGDFAAALRKPVNGGLTSIGFMKYLNGTNYGQNETSPHSDVLREPRCLLTIRRESTLERMFWGDLVMLVHPRAPSIRFAWHYRDGFQLDAMATPRDYKSFRLPYAIYQFWPDDMNLWGTPMRHGVTARLKAFNGADTNSRPFVVVSGSEYFTVNCSGGEMTYDTPIHLISAGTGVEVWPMTPRLVQRTTREKSVTPSSPGEIVPNQYFRLRNGYGVVAEGRFWFGSGVTLRDEWASFANRLWHGSSTSTNTEYFDGCPRTIQLGRGFGLCYGKGFPFQVIIRPSGNDVMLDFGPGGVTQTWGAGWHLLYAKPVIRGGSWNRDAFKQVPDGEFIRHGDILQLYSYETDIPSVNGPCEIWRTNATDYVGAILQDSHVFLTGMDESPWTMGGVRDWRMHILSDTPSKGSLVPLNVRKILAQSTSGGIFANVLSAAGLGDLGALLDTGLNMMDTFTGGMLMGTLDALYVTQLSAEVGSLLDSTLGEFNQYVGELQELTQSLAISTMDFAISPIGVEVPELSDVSDLAGPLLPDVLSDIPLAEVAVEATEIASIFQPEPLQGTTTTLMAPLNDVVGPNEEALAAERERVAREEAERLAAKQARLLQEAMVAKAEADRIAAEKAETERIAAEEAEKRRLAEEAALLAKQAAARAEAERIAQEAAAAEAARLAAFAAAEALRREQEAIAIAEKQRIAEEEQKAAEAAAALAELTRAREAEEARQRALAIETLEAEAKRVEQERLEQERIERERAAAIAAAEEERRKALAIVQAEALAAEAKRLEQERVAAIETAEALRKQQEADAHAAAMAEAERLRIQAEREAAQIAAAEAEARERLIAQRAAELEEQKKQEEARAAAAESAANKIDIDVQVKAIEAERASTQTHSIQEAASAPLTVQTLMVEEWKGLPLWVWAVIGGAGIGIIIFLILRSRSRHAPTIQ